MNKPAQQQRSSAGDMMIGAALGGLAIGALYLLRRWWVTILWTVALLMIGEQIPLWAWLMIVTALVAICGLAIGRGAVFARLRPALPILAEWEARRRRKEKKRGNGLLRKFGFVHAADETTYRATLTKQGVWTIDAPLPTLTDPQQVEKVIRERLAVVDGAQDVTVQQTAAGGHYRVTFHDQPKPDALAGIRYSEGVETDGALVVGRLEDQTEAVIDFREASHIAIQGMTRTGKSAFCYTTLSPLASLDDVVLGGIDPNRVLLSPWRFIERSAPWLAIGSDATAAVDVLAKYVTEMDRRMLVLDELGIEKFDTFTPDMPLLVCVLEEYPALLKSAEAHDAGAKPAERIMPTIKQSVSRLVMEGAKAGIRVVLIAQRMDAKVVDGDVRGQFGTRVTFAVDNSDAIKMLHPALGPEWTEAVGKFPPGRALFWRHREQQVMQADLTEYQEYRRRLGAPTTADNDG